MPPLPKPSAVLFCADLTKLTHFYRSVAAMTTLSGDPSHTVLEVEGFQLVVHVLKGEPGVHPDASGFIRVRQDSYLKVCLPVGSLAEARVRAAALGGHLQPPEREWEARGFRACDGYDPEGNVFQLRDSAA